MQYGAPSHLGMNFEAKLFGMTMNDIKNLTPLLRSTHNLANLSITNSLLNDESIHTLMSGLTHNETITSVNLSHNLIQNKGCEEIATHLSWPSCVLISLNLSDNRIGSEGGNALGNALNQNYTLHFLDIHLNELGEDGGVGLLEGVIHNQCLLSLNISSNQMRMKAG